MSPHSSTPAWEIPWTEQPSGLQSMGSLRVWKDWAISLSLFTFMHWRRKWQPTPVFLPGESQGGGAWWVAVYGVTQSRTLLKWFSSSSRNQCEVAPAEYIWDNLGIKRVMMTIIEIKNHEFITEDLEWVGEDTERKFLCWRMTVINVEGKIILEYHLCVTPFAVTNLWKDHDWMVKLFSSLLLKNIFIWSKSNTTKCTD